MLHSQHTKEGSERLKVRKIKMKHADDTVSNLENLETLITTLSKKTGKHHCIQKQFTENNSISIYQTQTPGR